MMSQYPYFKNPFFNYYRNPYYYNNYNYGNISSDNLYNSNNLSQKNNIKSKITSSDDNENNKTERNEKNNPDNSSEFIFEIFGIKLEFDDILLICLIFFLYKEEVHDTYLFIALILLLIS